MIANVIARAAIFFAPLIELKCSVFVFVLVRIARGLNRLQKTSFRANRLVPPGLKPAVILSAGCGG
jgi:hypothetical protein